MLHRILTAFMDSAWVQWGPFFLLILCGFGFPVPEDIILVSAGFLGADEGMSLVGTVALMYLGIMIGDLLIYYGGRRFGAKLVGFVIKQSNRERVQGLFKKYGIGVIFVGRFLPGLRTAIFFTAGTLHFSAGKFLLMDGIAAVISAPLFVCLGHWAYTRYADDLHLLEAQLGRTQLYILGGAVLFGVVMFYWLWAKSKNHKVIHET